MRINPTTLHWFKESQLYVLSADKLILETEPHSSLESLKEDEIKAFGLFGERKGKFTFDVKLDFAFHNLEDECGIILKRTEEDWCKFGVSLKNAEVNEIFCVRYQNGFKDTSIRSIGKDIHTIFLRIVYDKNFADFTYSTSGDRHRIFRYMELPEEMTGVPGVYACSPQNSYFDCTFSKMEINE